MAEIDRNALDGFVRQIRPRFEQALKEVVEIPTVSAEPQRKPEMQRAAEAASRWIREMGGEIEVLATKGNPVVLGRLDSSPAHPTVTVYNHLDVQPADGPDWVREPFKMAVEGDKYYGRGTTDDKGPALTVLMAAHYARKKLHLPVNIHFLWEMEEEIGSPNFEDCVKANREKLRTDSVVVSDTIWVARGKPAVSIGLRGLQGFTVRLQTGKKDVHSGLTGGLARNPHGELCDLVARCYDARTGKVRIPGFYKDVKKPSRDEVRSFVKSGFSLKEFQRAHELRSIRKLNAAQGATAIWAMPTLEVHGIAGGYQGPGIKTIVPGWAEAKLSMRLVPDQKPERMMKLVTRYMKRINPEVEIKAEHALEPYTGSIDGPYTRAAVQAVEWAYGKKPAFVREGGSIGAVLTMTKHLGCPVSFIGLSLPEHGYHAPNENYDWEQASGGIRAFAKYFQLLCQR